MKKYIYSFLGGILFGAICISVTWVIGALFGPLYQGEEESSRNFKIFLLAFLFFIILGAVLGFIRGKRSNKK
jgi:membrane protein DedA with SNARE-associated domain